jgi:plasmid stabilization system protein ParE
MTFRVETTAEAERDARELLQWLDSKGAGSKGIEWIAALEDAITTLSEFPHRCSLAPENTVFQFEVRHLLYGRAPHVYRILFTVERSTVDVFAHSAWTMSPSQPVNSPALST